jgi:hypothetical protein
LGQPVEFLATLAFHSAKVLANGRVIRALFKVRPQPASHGLPNYVDPWHAGLRLTLSNGATCEAAGQLSVNWDDYAAPFVLVTDATSTIPAGRYWYRLVIADGSGDEVMAYDNTGEWGGNAADHKGVNVTAGKAVQLTWLTPIPAGHTGRIYANTIGGTLFGAEDSLGLLVQGIAAGSTTTTINHHTFINASQAPTLPRVWILYFVIPAANIVQYGDTVTLTAPAGLATDEFGNSTGSASGAAVENLSRCKADGFFTDSHALSASGVEMYVSSTYGSDSNAGTVITAPKATLAAAWTAIPLRSGSHINLLRGDTFLVSTNLTGRYGLDGVPSTPLIMRSYYHDYGQGADPGTRPIISYSTNVINWHAGYTTHWENFIIRDIEWRPVTEGSGIAPIRFFQTVKGFWLTNCLFHSSQVGWETQNAHECLDSGLHRCIVRDNYRVGGGNVQGLYIVGTRGILVSQTVIDRCGYRDAEFAERTQFDHNVYLQNNGPEVINFATWSIRSAGVAFQQRGGGMMAYNIFWSNPFNPSFNRMGGSVHKCVASDSVLSSWGLDGSGHSAISIDIGINFVFSLALNTATASGGGFGLKLINSANYAAAEHYTRYAYLVGRYCTVINHGTGIQAGYGVFSGACAADHCILRNTQSQDVLQVIATDTGLTNIDWFDCDYNAYDSNLAAPFRVTIGATVTTYNFAGWQSAFGKDDGSLAQPITFVDGDYDIVDHSIAEGGPSTESGFIDALRNRGITVWSDLYDAQVAYGNFAVAYTPTNLPAIDLTPGGYYGHYDYRSGLPVFFTLTGPSSLEIDEIGTYTLTPSGTASVTVDLTDNGMPAGTFVPTLITWSAASDARTFTFEAGSAGDRVITAKVGTEVVATKSVTIEDPEEPPIPPTAVAVSSVEWDW